MIENDDPECPSPGTPGSAGNDPPTSATSGTDVAEAAPSTAANIQSPSTDTSLVAVPNPSLPPYLSNIAVVFLGNDGHAYILRLGHRRLSVLRIGTKACDAYLRRVARDRDRYLNSREVRELNESLIAHAEQAGEVRLVWYRFAPIEGGIEIDLGDDAHTRIRITAGHVTVLRDGSDTLFYRTPTMRSLPMPADHGELERLRKYANLDLADLRLLIGWLSYTIAHPKLRTTMFVILLLIGEQGSGKSLLCRIVLALLDPSDVQLRTFPRSERDFAIAAQLAHVLVYDNMRWLTPAMSDRLCIASTGGSLATRRLYSDTDQIALNLHVALVLNGLVPFVEEPDLAQRCLPLTLRHLDDGDRRDDGTLMRELDVDLPYIFRGLLDLIAGVFVHLPTVEVTNPERMLGYTRWLAAMEKVDGVPPGVYQAQYSNALDRGMLDSLEQNPLAAAVLDLAGRESGKGWSGTPADLLEELGYLVGRRASYAPEWPRNAIAMSKRLSALQVALRRHGVDVQFGRGRERRITITRLEGSNND